MASRSKDSLQAERWSSYWLLPFGTSSSFYIAGHYFKYEDFLTPTPTNAIFKCLPLLALMLFISKTKTDTNSQQKGNWLSYKSAILLALLFGTVGDWCLVFPAYFIWGMLTFAIGHVFFIYAYGFTPLRGKLGFFIYSICAVLLLLIRDQAPNRLIRDAMPFYSVFLVTMCWRATARVNRTFPRVVGAIGGILFVISDLFLVLQMQKEFPYGRIFVMTTYYLSQLCASLSVLEFVTTKED